MKGVYWRAQKVPSWALALVAVVAGVCLFGVERCPMSDRPEGVDLRLEAARVAQRAFDQIGLARLQTTEPIDPRLDPTTSGLIGVVESPLASNYGHLPAKRASINPNFAAMVVEWLQELDARPGDAVAVGLSGSFPAMNIAVYSAVQAMGIEPLIIIGGSASQYGATVPGLSWIDMERELREAGLIRFGALAATLGGDQDRALLQPPDAREILVAAMKKNGTMFLDPESLEQSIERRLDIIDAACGNRRLVAYINVGGGEASLGNKADRERYPPGMTRSPLPELTYPSVARTLMERGVPLLNITHIEELALRYGFPRDPMTPVPVGQGTPFVDTSKRQWFAVVAILLVLATLFAVTKLDFVQRVSAAGRADGRRSRAPKQMV